MRLDLADDPAVIGLAARLGLDEFGVVGRLHRLWVWANQQLADGNAASVTEKWIDRYTMTPGFAAALVEVGWLTVDGGGFSIPKFDRWNSKGAKKRLLTSRRVKDHRNAPSVTKALPEERREENKKPPSEVPAGKPAAAKKPAKSKAPTEKKPRPPNPLFDTLADITGSDPHTSGSHVGRVCAALGKADPPYTPEELRDFGDRIGELCPWTEGRRPTLGEVEKYIGLVRNGQGKQRPRGPKSVQDIATSTLMNLFGDQQREPDSEAPRIVQTEPAAIGTGDEGVGR